MGSFGSGNWADACLRKVSVEICNEISIKLLKDNGFLDGSKTGTVEWKNVTGDVVGILHGDDIYANDHVLSTAAKVFEDESIDSCYGDLQYVDRENPDRVVRQ